MTDLVPLSDRRPGIGPPRFGLRTLLMLMTGFCLMLVSYVWFGAYVAMLVGLFALAVLGHVAGNWLGTKLRDAGDQHLPPEHAGQVTHSKARGKTLEPQHFAPKSNLHQRSPLPRYVIFTVLGGALLAALGGGLLVWLLNGPRATWSNVAAGGTAFGALGAMATFLVVAFLQAGWQALQQAVDEEKKP
jgi:hypothetical protein